MLHTIFAHLLSSVTEDTGKGGKRKYETFTYNFTLVNYSSQVDNSAAYDL